jgi:hypothetical protein
MQDIEGQRAHLDLIPSSSQRSGVKFEARVVARSASAAIL